MITVRTLISGGVPTAQYQITNEVSFITLSSDQKVTFSVSNVLDFITFGSALSFLIENVANFQKAYKYYTLVDLTQEDLMAKEKFLADYHVIKFLAEKAYLSSVDVVRLLTHMSNLLRLMSEHNVDEAHLFTMRVVRKYSDTLQKNIFFITEY